MSPGEQFLSEIISSFGSLLTLLLTGFLDTFFVVFTSVVKEAFGLTA